VAAWRIEPGGGDYPACLAELDDGRPPVLHGAGSRELVTGLEHESTVTIVGSRRASAYGLSVAQQLAHDLATAGVCVVSGMALGIDAAAHRGALDAGGRTIAVLANGPEIAYPPRHRALHDEIAASGALISEQPPGTAPRKDLFRARNRIMAALGKVVVIVEAALPSGSLITAHEAMDHGRTVGAVPGRVGSRVAAGTNDLIATGAHLIRDARDVLDLLYDVGATERRSARPGPELEPEAARALAAVEAGAATVDQVVLAAGLDPRAAAIALAQLELLGYLTADPAGTLSRSALPAPGLD
jgi:DNA processing protein